MHRVKKITVQLLFCIITPYLFAQSYVWNTLGNGDKKDLFLEQNYIDELTGQEPVENGVNVNEPVNRDICIRTGNIEVESDKSVSLLMGTGGLTIENANLYMGSVEKAGIDLGSGNTLFTINNANVQTQYIHNATIVMEGRSQLTLDGDESCLENTTIELRSPDAYVVFTNIKPAVVSTGLKNKVSVNTVFTSQNMRLTQFYEGTIIRALPQNNIALHVFGDENQQNYLGSFADGIYGKIGINSDLKLKNSQYTITGFGDGIGGKEDMFHFAYRAVDGNGEISSVCDSVENNNAQTKAGLMVRASLEIDAPCFMLCVHPDNRVSLIARTSKQGDMTTLRSPTGNTGTPKYIKITREDNLFAAFYSETNQEDSWIQLGETIEIAMDNKAFFGLARSSSQGSLGANAYFSQVKLQQNNVVLGDASYGVFEAHEDVYKACPFEDQVSSFMLKKGYELCMSSDGAGQGYSQVWIATEEDIFINLPEKLSKKNSFFRITPWRWATKKGYGGKDGKDKDMLQVSWNYKWEPSGSSTANVEFVPMIKGRKQNKDFRWEEVRIRKEQTHFLGFNEPMSEKQGDLSVDEAIALWPKAQMMGLRLGSPCSDGGTISAWLKEFMNKANAKGYRVDYICLHCYIKKDAKGLRDLLFSEYQKYGKPIWLTEFNARLESIEEEKKFISEITKLLEEAPFVERYAYFNDTGVRNLFNAAKTDLSAIGKIYRDVKSNPAYISPDYGKWLQLNLAANFNEKLSAEVSFSVSADVIEQVEYFVNGVSVGTANTAPFNLSNVESPDKLINVRAVARTVFGEYQSSNTVQLLNSTTGIMDTKEPTVKLFPNPVQDRLFLSIPTNWNLMDLQGRSISSGYGSEIDTADLPNGMFFIQINNTLQKVIKTSVR